MHMHTSLQVHNPGVALRLRGLCELRDCTHLFHASQQDGFQVVLQGTQHRCHQTEHGMRWWQQLVALPRSL